MTEADLRDKIILESSDNSFHCFGYSYLFDKRAQRFRKRVKLLQVFGIAIPATVGATAVGYGYDNSILKYALILSAPLLVIQFTVSIIAIIYEWDTELAYSYEASQDYNNIYDRFKKLYKLPPVSYTELDKQFEIINTEYGSRSRQDAKHGIKEWELRMGMRYSLREHQKPCATCGKIPTDMEPTECGVCGKFKKQKT
jgi:mobilome CxxCx(11)CxxC protein